MNLISRGKNREIELRTDFKVDFTKNSCKCFAQLALDLISRKKDHEFELWD